MSTKDWILAVLAAWGCAIETIRAAIQIKERKKESRKPQVGHQPKQAQRQ
jgi:hypothetical protein